MLRQRKRVHSRDWESKGLRARAGPGVETRSWRRGSLRSLASRGGGGGANPLGQTWRSSRVVLLWFAGLPRPGSNAHSAASTAPAAASGGTGGRCYHLPARLESSARPGPSPSRGECAGPLARDHHPRRLRPLSLVTTARSGSKTLPIPKCPLTLGPSLSGSSLSTPQHPPWKRETLDLAAWKSEPPDTFITSPNSSGLGLSQTCPLEYNFPSPHRSFFREFLPHPSSRWSLSRFLGEGTLSGRHPHHTGARDGGWELLTILRSSLPPRGNSPLESLSCCVTWLITAPLWALARCLTKGRQEEEGGLE